MLIFLRASLMFRKAEPVINLTTENTYGQYLRDAFGVHSCVSDFCGLFRARFYNDPDLFTGLVYIPLPWKELLYSSLGENYRFPSGKHLPTCELHLNT